MKKFILTLTTLLIMTVSANAMSYEQARKQALFLTDKMAYELNLTEDQYEAAYEINLDYLMSVNSYDDLYGVYWTHRNLDLSYILLDWQYTAYCAASYFYRPLYWEAGYWHFGIYARYPHRNYFYFGYPHFFYSYYGGHSWHRNGGRSWYHGRDWGPKPGPKDRHIGMKDGYHRGDYKNGFDKNTNNHHYSGRGNTNFGNNRGKGNDNKGHGSKAQDSGKGNSTTTQRPRINGNGTSTRESSTRTTVTQSGARKESVSSSFRDKDKSSSNGKVNSTPTRSFTPSTGASKRQSTESRSSFGNRSSSSSFGGSTTRSSSSRGSSSFGSGSSRTGGSFGGGSRSGGSGGGRSGGGRR